MSGRRGMSDNLNKRIWMNEWMGYYRSNGPTNSVKALKKVVVLRLGFNPTRSTSPCYSTTHACNIQTCTYSIRRCSCCKPITHWNKLLHPVDLLRLHRKLCPALQCIWATPPLYQMCSVSCCIVVRNAFNVFLYFKIKTRRPRPIYICVFVLEMF